MLRAMGWLLLLPLVGVAGCGDGGPQQSLHPTDAVAPDLSVASSGCITPKFTVVLVPTSNFSFDGVLSGDLEGTVTMLFDPGSLKFAGVTLSNSGTAHWVISGGILPGLGTFDTEFKNRNLLVDRPGSPATLFENIGTHRATGGVDKANLTYSGTFTVLPSQQAIHDYQGYLSVRDQFSSFGLRGWRWLAPSYFGRMPEGYRKHL